MKVVLMHDWLTSFRGGERVLEAFCEMFPDAPLYTLIHIPGSSSKLIEQRQIHSSFLSKIPGIKEHYRKFLPLFPKAAESLRIQEEADLVLSSSHCVIKGVKKPKNSKHISYIHSPMRYLYDQFDVYFGSQAPLYQQLGAKVFRSYLTQWDKKSNDNVDLMVANSHFVSQRIQTYYARESKVVHPFVELSDFQKNFVEKEDFYLMLGAFAPNKRMDLGIKAFNKLGKKLKVIGFGQQERELKAMASSHIEFLGQVSRIDLLENLYKAKALIFPSTEDFGITPLEALAAGTPVIAFKKGGVLETLNENVAVFFDEAHEDSLEKAILNFEQKSFEKNVLRKRAQDFSKEKFKEKMQEIINQEVS